MIKLYIDDIRNPKENDCIVVRNAREAVLFMELNGCPDFISFDHDLGDAKAQTGFDIAKWIVERDLDTGNFIPNGFEYFVHSANPVGAANIEGLFNNYLDVKARD